MDIKKTAFDEVFEYLNKNLFGNNRFKKRLKEELSQIDKELEDLKLLGATLKERLQTLQKELPEQKEKLQQYIIEETTLRNYFEEELDLKLILNREGRTVYECNHKSNHQPNMKIE